MRKYHRPLWLAVLFLAAVIAGCSKGSNSGSSGELPYPPSGLVASALSTAQISLNWTDNASNELIFKIERKLGAAGTYGEIASPDANSTSYTDSGLVEGKTYYYRLRASNGTGDSAYCDEANTTTRLYFPNNLVANPASASQVNLSWTDNSSNESGYKVERSTDGNIWTEITATGPNINYYYDIGRGEATAYYYRVKAYNSGNESDYSTSTNATTPLSPPTSLNTTVISPTRIDLVWLDNSGKETGYKVERKAGSGGTYGLIYTTAANAIAYSDTTGLIEGIAYYYRIYAYNGSTTSAYSNEASSAIQLNGPTSQIAATVSSSAVNLTWADNSANEDGFKIERSIVSGSGFVQIGTAGTGITSYLSAGLTDGTRYYYRVRAYNAATNSPYSNEANAITTVNAPQALWVSAISSSQINVNWVDFSNSESEFGVERSLTSGGGFSQVATTTANTTVYNNTGLTDGTRYYYRARAWNATAGYSAYSNEADAITILTAPSALTAATVSSSQINLNWTDDSNAEAGFRVERGLTTTAFAEIATVGAGITSYNNTTGLMDGTVYYYRIQAYNGAYGNSAWSNETAATTTFNAPTSLSAVTVSSSRINLNWTDTSGSESGYKIERSLTSGSGFSQIDTVGPDVTAYSNSGLDDETTYYYQVRAYNTTGNSAYCAEDSATTPFGAPSNLAATGVSPSQINLNWTDNSNHEDGFKIERKTGAAGIYSEIDTVGTDVTTYPDSGLPTAVEYYYQVRAYNVPSGNSGYSNEASAITPLEKVTNPNPADGSSGIITTTALSWTAVSGATSYDVYMGLTALSMAYQTNVTVDNYTPGTLSYGTTYYWKIDARVGASATAGDTWSFTTAPTAGANSLADAVDNFTLAWTTGSTGDSFNWLYQTNTTHDGEDAVKSDTLSMDANKESWLQTTVNGSGIISFWWNVDCEAHPSAQYDRLEFYIDAVEKSRIASTSDGVPTGWSAISFTISTGGAHILKWRYFVDDNTIRGQNCGWVDQVVWTGSISPMVITDAATNIASRSATLNGSANPNALMSYAYFEYGETPSFAEGTTTVQSLGSGTGVIPITATISGLNNNTLYYFRLVVSNATGTNYGGNQTFTTAPPAPPTITTSGASDVTSDSAVLNASANPNWLSTSAYFEWGLTTSYGNTMSSKDMGSGNSIVPISDTISGLLLPNNTYYYRLVAANLDGTSYGLSRTFTTAPAPNAPFVNTGNATTISAVSAILNGTVNPNGFSTDAYFEYGLTESYGSATDLQDVGNGLSYQPVSATINGLSDSTTYNFRIVATNANGTTYGVNHTLTTPGYRGTGADGAVTINSLKNLNVDAIASGRTVADGWCSRITALTANTATLAITPPANTFASNDEVIIISLKGTVSSSNIGNYEFLRVASVAGAVITFHENKTRYYGETTGADNNLATTQYVILQRVPNYTNVTVNWNATLTCDAWNGVTGGVLAFRATGTVSVGSVDTPTTNRFAYITTSSKGHRNGTGSDQSINAPAGETYFGGLYPSGGSGGTLGSADSTAGIATPDPGGGGGGAGVDFWSGSGSGASGTTGPAGGGGGGAMDDFGGGYWAVGAGGGGAGYGSEGAGGEGYQNGSNGSGTSGGRGGDRDPRGLMSGTTTTAGGGGGGGTYGISSALDTKAYLGAGGGAGGGALSVFLRNGGSGGPGGGFIFIGANAITIYYNTSASGTDYGYITANGGTGESLLSDGGSSWAYPGGGGGGAGGSVVIQVNTIDNQHANGISANGGTGGAGANDPPAPELVGASDIENSGGNGGSGRTYLKYTTKTGSDPVPAATYYYGGTP